MIKYLTDGLIFLAAACLEVSGDAVIRQGLKGSGVAMVGIGAALLALYGIVVNATDLDFSRLIGAYVAVFALISFLVGKFYFGEAIAPSTWCGLAIVIVGGLTIQFGPK